MDKESEGFAYLRRNFPKWVRPKMKEGNFVSPQIQQLFEDQNISTKIKILQEEGSGRHLKKSAEIS